MYVPALHMSAHGNALCLWKRGAASTTTPRKSSRSVAALRQSSLSAVPLQPSAGTARSCCGASWASSPVHFNTFLYGGWGGQEGMLCAAGGWVSHALGCTCVDAPWLAPTSEYTKCMLLAVVLLCCSAMRHLFMHLMFGAMHLKMEATAKNNSLSLVWRRSAPVPRMNQKPLQP